MHRLAAVLAVLLAGTLVVDVQAQNPRRTERAFVSSPAALGMGDVGVARPFETSSFFYNPAHVPHSGTTVRALGLQGALSNQVRDQVRFYNDRVSPAVDEGLDNLPADELRSLYNDALGVTAAPSQGRVGVLLPALTRQVGDLVGVGGGLFAKTDGSAQFSNGGLGIPQVTLVSRSDFIGAVSVGTKVPGTGLSLGTTLKYTKRYLSYKNKPLDTFSSDEQVVLLEGTNVGADLGVLYEVPFLPIPGNVTVGLSLYDLLNTGYNYDVYGTASDIPVVGGLIPDSGALDATRVQAEVDLAKRQFNLEQSYRFGAAYTLNGAGPLTDLAVAIDYLGYGSPEVDQSFLAQMHLGPAPRWSAFSISGRASGRATPRPGPGSTWGCSTSTTPSTRLRRAARRASLATTCTPPSLRSRCSAALQGRPTWGGQRGRELPLSPDQCTRSGLVAPSPMPSTRSIARTFIRAWDASHHNVVDEWAAPSLTVSYPHFPAPLEGPEAFAEMLAQTHHFFPDLRVEVHDVIADGRRAVVRWTYRGAFEHGEMFGVEAAGQSIAVTGITTYTIEDDHVVREDGIVDNLGLMQQLGARPDAA